MITKTLLRITSKLTINSIYLTSTTTTTTTTSTSTITTENQPPQNIPQPPPPSSSSKPNKKPILTLSQLIQLRKSGDIVNLDLLEQTNNNLHLNILRAIKQNLYRDVEQGQKIIRILNKYKQDMQHIKKFIYLILPIDELFPQLNQYYKHITLKFLTQISKPHKQQIFNIAQNLQRMISNFAQTWKDQYWVRRDYSKEQKIARLLVQCLIAQSQEFDISMYIKITEICSILGVDDYQLGAFLLRYLGVDSCRIKMKDILIVLRYLSQIKIFPYEYFYKNKSKWIKTIQSYNKYSTKKSTQSIKLFQVIISQNPMYCEKLIKRLQDVLLEAMPSLDHEELTHLWYISNRAKFGIYRELIEKMLEKMCALVSGMQIRELCLLVRGFDHFKEIQDYEDVCRGILEKIQKKLSNNRQYEKEIVKQIFKKLDNRKKKVEIV